MKKIMIAACMAVGAGYASNAICQTSDAGASPMDLPSPPQAPAPDSAPAKTHGGGAIEEVIVTATRREESAQSVPISITVFNPQQLANANVTNSSDLATYTPSLTTNNRFGPENASFSIRGFTQDLRTTASVGTYFADVVSPRGQSTQTSGDGAGPGSLFDLQSVQVLKGPQGTLFGRNTTGGAVLIVPQKPTGNFEGYVEASGGEYGARRFQGVVNVPVTSNFKLRFGVDTNERDGYIHNVTGIGTDAFGNVDYTALRLSSVWDITPDLENYTILQFVNSDSSGNTSQVFACNQNPLPTVNPFYAFTGIPCQSQLASLKRLGQDGFYDIVSDIAKPQTLIHERRAINTTTWHIDDDLQLKNIAAYAHLVTVNGSEVFGTEFHLATDTDARREFSVGSSLQNPSVPVTSQQTVVEELQLQGQSFGERLKWTSGAYFELSTPDGASGNNAAEFLSCQLSTVTMAPSQYNCYDPLAGALGSVLNEITKQRYLNLAVYSEGTYQFTDKISATLGLRYTDDRTEGEVTKIRYTFIGPVEQAPKTATSSPQVASRAPTGQFQLSYKPDEQVMIYGKLVRGYRQGSIVMAADPGIDTFKPETVNTVELGAKTTFDGPIPFRLNFAAFYNDLVHQQLQFGYVSSTSGTTTTIANAGKSKIAGAELEGFFDLSHGFTFNLSGSFLNTKLLKEANYTSQVTAAAGPEAGLTATPIADVGDSLPFAPVYDVVGTLAYRLPLSDEAGKLDVSATYVETGRQRAAATTSSPYAILPTFGLLNLNLTWLGIFQSNIDLSMYATNVLNEKYVLYVGGTYNTLGFESREGGMPRMAGARLKYNF